MAALAVPGVGYMLVVFAAPLLLLLVSSLYGPDGLGLDGYRRILGDPYYHGVIWNSVRLGLGTTLIALVLGYPAAFALARAKGYVQVLLFTLIFLPLTVSIIVKTFGLTLLFRRDGPVNWALMGLGFTDAPIRLVFTEFSLFVGMVNVFLPFMILPIYSVVRMIDTRLTDAAACLGASPVYRFTHVVLPLSLPGIIAGVSLTFSLAVAAYVTPSLLIGDRFMTMSRVMAKSYLNLRDFQLGSSMAVLLLLIAIVVILASAWLSQRFSYRER
jgi:putative spermidine/putrescine transport system permease protein